MENAYWTLEGWGSDYPPENAEEIIDHANELIEAYAEDHDKEEVYNYSSRLWDAYCMTDTLPEEG